MRARATPERLRAATEGLGGARRGDGGGDIDLDALDVELPRGFGRD